METLDRLKEMGFRWATKAGISIGITDMIIPKEKSTQLEKAYREIAEVEKQYRRGIITDGERKNKVQDSGRILVKSSPMRSSARWK